LLRHLSLALQITLIAYDDDREIILILNSQDLLLEDQDLIEALSACNAVHQEESFTGSHILLSHRRVFFLAGSIEDIEKGNLVVDYALLAVGIWEGSAYVARN
jgi:hypothetical protein